MTAQTTTTDPVQGWNRPGIIETFIKSIYSNDSCILHPHNIQ